MTTNTQPIPFLDLVSPHKELEGELVEVFRHALATAGFIGGPAVESFEREFALFCRTKFCVGVGSGTDALRFALLAAGVGAWDTVLTVPNTFIATTEAISQTGARPEFIDVDPRTYNMDPVRLAEYLDTNCTFSQARGKMVHNQTGSVIRAIIPVHLYGQMVEMDPILYLARKYNITVIEDACQAHGAQYYSTETSSWQVAGSMGKAAAFSFYPGKNLGACGEAGAVTTNDEEIARRIRMLRDHGQAKKYYHDVEGYNGRLDAIQAGILHTKLHHLPEWNEKRRKLA
ncbi:MAG TPA: DegT/DnrJ/EryC1/StrS family aminotransferase, partial [Terriglobales bacterium]